MPRLTKTDPKTGQPLISVNAELPAEYTQKLRDLHAWMGLKKREVLMSAIDALHDQHRKLQGGAQP